MIADHETNVVYVADTLERKYPDVHRRLALILRKHAIPLRVIRERSTSGAATISPSRWPKTDLSSFATSPTI